jgi:hypothetical protein
MLLSEPSSENDNKDNFDFMKEVIEEEEDDDDDYKHYFLDGLCLEPSDHPKKNQENSNNKIFVTSNNKEKSKPGRRNRGIKNKIHNKFFSDNILRKIQVHYISFIISFTNEILTYFKIQKKFLNLSYDFKKNINKNFVRILKNCKICELLSNKVSGKYKIFDEYYNYKLMKEISQNEILSKILGLNYLTFFKNFYFRNSRNIDLHQYGLNTTITLPSHVKNFNNLVESARKFSKIYESNILRAVKANYDVDIIFLLH